MGTACQLDSRVEISSLDSPLFIQELNEMVPLESYLLLSPLGEGKCCNPNIEFSCPQASFENVPTTQINLTYKSSMARSATSTKTLSLSSHRGGTQT